MREKERGRGRERKRGEGGEREGGGEGERKRDGWREGRTLKLQPLHLKDVVTARAA